jgi:hypothetical protein
MAPTRPLRRVLRMPHPVLEPPRGAITATAPGRRSAGHGRPAISGLRTEGARSGIGTLPSGVARSRSSCRCRSLPSPPRSRCPRPRPSSIRRHRPYPRLPSTRRPRRRPRTCPPRRRITAAWEWSSCLCARDEDRLPSGRLRFPQPPAGSPQVRSRGRGLASTDRAADA